jgi:hypothetical protein
MVIHARYALETNIVVEASLIRNGMIDEQFRKAIFSTAPVITWLAKSKGKPIVSCLKHAMTEDVHTGGLSQPNQTTELPNTYVQASQPMFNNGLSQAVNQLNLYSQQPFQYSHLSQYSQFSEHP